MKRIFSGLIGGIILYSTTVNSAKAQLSFASMSSSKTNAITMLADVGDGETAGDEKTAATSVSKESLKETKANLKTAKASFKALKANFKAAENFKKKFKDEPNAKWFVEPDAISALFNRNDIQTRVIYNKRGNWVHTISYCEESKMPVDIRSLIRSNYPDYNIKGMHEIKEGSMTFCIVYLEDNTSLKQISVYNGPLGLYKEFKKQ